jgi:hypothetical protein
MGELSLVQLIASGCAAVTVAVVVPVGSSLIGSFGGPKGTLTGAFLGSVVFGIAGAFYAETFRRAHRGVRRVAVSRIQVQRRHVITGAVIGAVALAGSLGAITGIEYAAKEPISAITTGDHQGGTTLGGVTAPSPSDAPTAPVVQVTPAVTSPASAAPVPSPTMITPGGSASAPPAAPASSPASTQTPGLVSPSGSP